MEIRQAEKGKEERRVGGKKKEFLTQKARGSQRFFDPSELALTAGTGPFLCWVELPSILDSWQSSGFLGASGRKGKSWSMWFSQWAASILNSEQEQSNKQISRSSGPMSYYVSTVSSLGLKSTTLQSNFRERPMNSSSSSVSYSVSHCSSQSYNFPIT